MKKIISIIIFFISTMVYQGCSEEFLDLSDPSNPTIPDFYQSQSHFESAVNSLYSHFGVYYGLTSDMLMVSYNDFRDDTFSATNYWYAEIANNSFTGNTTQVMWSNMYKGIYYANMILDRIDNPVVMFETGVRERVKAEALFLRAFSYFQLVKSFGDVPLLLKETPANEGLATGKTPISTIYNTAIVPDLQYAVNNLPEEWPASDYGRFTKYGASALLANVYIYMSGYPLNENHWTDAKPLLESIINSTKYANVENWEDLWAYSNEKNSEIILGVIFTDGNENLGNNYIRQIHPGNNGFMNTMKSTATTFWETADIRKDITIETEFYQKNDPTSEIITNYAAPSKVPRAEAEDPLLWTKHLWDWPAIRFTEVQLNYAEVLAEIAGTPTTEALAIVDANRDRAGLAPLAGIASLQDFRTALLNERRAEFMFEMKRWDDLVRTNTFIDALAACGVTVTDDYKYFPLPQSQRDLMGDELLPQNPGYSF